MDKQEQVPEVWNWRGQAMGSQEECLEKGAQWEAALGNCSWLGQRRCGQREGKPQLRRRTSLFLSDLALGRSPI